jgi:hypothetical protein
MTDAASTTENRTLAQTPKRLSNAAYRPREYLTDAEVDRLIKLHASEGAMETGMLVRSCWRIAMACELQSCASCVGRSSISGMAACM